MEASPTSAPTDRSAPTPIELLTIGTADELYARFGHTALRIGDAVYNYGYTDFASPHLVLDFIRGRARFWGEREGYRETLRRYRLADRTVVRRALHLTSAQLLRLQRGLRGVERRYVYHHFDDNCATRLRDLLDDAFDGAIKRALASRPAPRPPGLDGPLTIRALVRRGFADRLELLVASALFLGRRADRPLDAWQGAFLPDLLEAGLASVHTTEGSLLGSPTLAYQRRGPPTGANARGDGAVVLLWTINGGLLLGAALLLVLLRARRRAGGLLLLCFALIGSILGLLLWTLAVFSSVAELAQNEWALLFWPTDLWLLVPAIALLRGRFCRPRFTLRYLGLRLSVLALFGLGQLAGLLVQRPLVIYCAALILLLSFWIALRLLPSCDR